MSTSFERISKVTPLLKVPLDNGGSFFIKDETQQISGNFKIRGSENKIKNLNGDITTLVTASTGNHALGLCTVAKRYGFKAEVFMPENTPGAKVEKIKKMDASINFVEGGYLNAEKKAQLFSQAVAGRVFVHSFDDLDIINGHKSIYLEIEEQLGSAPEEIFVPVGGGGLLTATIEYSEGKNTVICGAEYEPYERIHKLLAGEVFLNNPPSRPSTEGIAISTIGKHAHSAIKRCRSFSSMSVNDDDLIHAVRFLWERLRVRAELGGAAGVAAALKRGNLRQPAVCIVSGGNVDADVFQEIING